MGWAAVLLSFAIVLPGALAQTSGATQPQEVRIRSAPYHPPAPTISVQTNLVEAGVTVRDRKGTPVGGFHAPDFQIFDNLKPQSITFFSEQRTEPDVTTPAAIPAPNEPSSTAQPANPPTAPPRFIALFFDDTHSGIAGFERSRHAAEKLIQDGLHPGDRVGIFTGSGATTLDFTTDTGALLSALAGMKRRPDTTAIRGYGACPTLTAYQAFVIAKHIDASAKRLAISEVFECEPGIPYYVAAIQAQDAADSLWDVLRSEPSKVIEVLTLVARRLAAEPGTRVLLMVSPGFISEGMDRQFATLVDMCLRNRIVMNTLDDEGLLAGDSPESLGVFNGPRTNWAQSSLPQRNMIVQTFLADAAASTGGQFIHNNNDLTASLLSLAAVPDVSYLLGFSPTDPPDGAYHKLKVTTTKAGKYDVSARPGYFATPPSSPVEKPPETAQQRFDRVVASTESLDEIHATVQVQAVADEDKEDRFHIQVDIALDAKSLPFTDVNGASVQQLTFVTVLEDAQGNYLEGKQAVMDMNLTSETRSDLDAKGIKAATSFVVPTGSYRIREVIREAVQNRLAALSTPVEAR
jgi:VWFA-related protein